MHPTILAKRKAEAVGKVVFASEALAEHFSLVPVLIAGLHPVGIKDPQVRDLMLLEAVADALLAIGIQAGAIKEGISMETVKPEAATPVDEPAEPDRPPSAEEDEPEPPAKQPARGRTKKS